jgi:hypothetical protein
MSTNITDLKNIKANSYLSLVNTLLVITFLVFISQALCRVANLNAGHLDHKFLIKQVLKVLCIYIIRA